MFAHRWARSRGQDEFQKRARRCPWLRQPGQVVRPFRDFHRSRRPVRRALNAVRRIKHDWNAEGTHDPQACHVIDQTAVAKERAAFAEHHAVLGSSFISRRRVLDLVDRITHVLGSHELACLDIDRLSGLGGGATSKSV